MVNGLFAVVHGLFAVVNGLFAVVNAPFTVVHAPFTVVNSPFAVVNAPFAVVNRPFTWCTACSQSILDGSKRSAWAQLAVNVVRSTLPPTVPGGFRYVLLVPFWVSAMLTVYSRSVSPP